jgi:hypothetical protein
LTGKMFAKWLVAAAEDLDFVLAEFMFCQGLKLKAYSRVAKIISNVEIYEHTMTTVATSPNNFSTSLILSRRSISERKSSKF